MKVILDSDSAVATDITQKYDVEEIFVDRPLHKILTEGRKAWAVSNYTLILVPTLAILGGSTSGGGVLFVMMTVAMFTAFVAGTSSSRNMAMATEVMNTASKSEYDTGVLMVGKAHKEPIQRILETETDEVEVVN